MEKQEVEKCPTVDDASHLNRNRSFKTKQLVRSQAIRESASPPRTVSPSLRECERDDKPRERDNKMNVKVTGAERSPSESSQEGDGYGEERRQPVEIQVDLITQGSWQSDDAHGGHSAAGRGARSAGDGLRDLLSYNPRVACVCGACAPCPHCRGRRRRYIGINKQDSGIGVDEYADCETNGVVADMRKASSLDTEEYCRCPERREKPRHTFTRTDSEEPTGPELVAFISDTLNKNAKDRTAMLKIEKELHALVHDAGRCIVKFPVMTSYGRMLVHRCAALFQLSHHPDQYNKNCVIVSKAGTSGGRIPCTSFKAWCVPSFPPASPARAPDPAPLPHQAKSILKRACGGAAGRGAGALAARSKSLEQREQDYERARRRIFSQDKGSSCESPWPWLSGGPVKLLTPEHGPNKLLKVQSLESASPPGSWRARGVAVAKSHSFGGYTDPPPTRTLSRQGDLASSSWRLSPSSSGYKTLSLRSTDSVTPSPTGGGTPEPAPPGGGGGGGPAVPAPPSGGAVVWAVTDMARVPPGVTVIHPQTGRPLTNPDGSLYRFDPDNPPHVYEPARAALHHQHEQIESSDDKRRGRLEKQHSFIDHEVEYPQTEQYQYEYEAQGNEHHAEEKAHLTDSPPSQFLPASQHAATEPPLSTQTPPASHIYQGTVYYSPHLYTQTPHYEEQMQSAPQLSQYMSDVSTQAAPLGKDATPLLEHTLRNMVLSSNVMCGAAAASCAGGLPSACHYVQHAPCRIEAVAPLYGAATPALDEQKVPSPPDNTFRIDASYPYPPLEYTSYLDPPAAPALGPQPAVGPPSLQQRSYSVGYGGEALAPAAPYPMGGVYGVPWALSYGAPLLGGPAARPQHAPLLYPHHYNTLLYPQMVPQYPVCTPMFTSVAPRAATPPSAERGGPTGSPPQGAPAYRSVRNNGHGILGRYPQHANSDVQLTGAARAIVNSIRQLQANNTYHKQDRRYEYRDRHDRTDRRPDGRGDGQTDRHTYKHSYSYNDRHSYQQDRNNYQNRSNYTEQGSYQEKTHVQDRNSNIQDKSNIKDRNSQTQDRSTYAQDRNSNTQDRNNIQDMTHYSDRNSNVQDNSQDVPDRTVHDRNIYQERNYRNYQQTNQLSLDNAQNNRETNTKDMYQDKVDICSEHTKEKLQVQSNTQESTNNVHDKSQSMQERGNEQDVTLGNAVDTSNAQERTMNALERHGYQDRRAERGACPPLGGGVGGAGADRRLPPHAAPRPPLHHYRPHYLFRQMSPSTWSRRSAAPAPLHPGMPHPHPRRPHPDTRSGRRY